MVLFQVFAGVGLEGWDVEDTIGVIAVVYALGRQCLDSVGYAELERCGTIECDELVIVVVDRIWIGKQDGEDTNLLGRCRATGDGYATRV